MKKKVIISIIITLLIILGTIITTVIIVYNNEKDIFDNNKPTLIAVHTYQDKGTAFFSDGTIYQLKTSEEKNIEFNKINKNKTDIEKFIVNNSTKEDSNIKADDLILIKKYIKNINTKKMETRATCKYNRPILKNESPILYIYIKKKPIVLEISGCREYIDNKNAEQLREILLKYIY